MRTTLDIDPEVLNVVKEQARRQRRSAGAVLSDLARQALTAGPQPAASDDVDNPFYGFRPLPKGDRFVSN
ncbi:MAG: hypothetical protein WBM40_03360 [Thiohalocapsa sp.]